MNLLSLGYRHRCRATGGVPRSHQFRHWHLLLGRCSTLPGLLLVLGLLRSSRLGLLLVLGLLLLLGEGDLVLESISCLDPLHHPIGYPVEGREEGTWGRGHQVG